jgi:hypothetical protein
MHHRRRVRMSWVEWMLWFALFSIYITALFTVCALTFRKGYVVLGIIGIFVPLLWLIGAFLPAKRGSRYDVQQAMYYQQQMQEYTR